MTFLKKDILLTTSEADHHLSVRSSAEDVKRENGVFTAEGQGPGLNVVYFPGRRQALGVDAEPVSGSRFKFKELCKGGRCSSHCTDGEAEAQRRQGKALVVRCWCVHKALHRVFSRTRSCSVEGGPGSATPSWLVAV